MQKVTCVHCGESDLEAYWRLDEAMAVHCKGCDKSFPASKLKGCPRCGEQRTRMILDGDTTIQRCDSCSRTFPMAELGNCPHCDGAELQFITLVDDVTVDCRKCGRSGKRGEMLRVSGNAPAADQGSGCFVATAACGDPHAPEVVELRRFRERVLRPSRPGCALIAAYEWLSPPLARCIARSVAGRHLALALVVRPALVLTRRFARGTGSGRES